MTTTGYAKMPTAEEFDQLLPGEIVEWTDGDIRWRFEVHHDEEASINDYESDGKVSHYFDWRDGHKPRPAGFTGRARKIEVDRSGFVWWEPYTEEYGWQDENDQWKSGKWEQLPPAVAQKELDRVRDLIQMGFRQVRLAKQEKCDMGVWHTVADTWLGGIDSLENGYGRTLAEDMQGEVDEL